MVDWIQGSLSHILSFSEQDIRLLGLLSRAIKRFRDKRRKGAVRAQLDSEDVHGGRDGSEHWEDVQHKLCGIRLRSSD